MQAPSSSPADGQVASAQDADPTPEAAGPSEGKPRGTPAADGPAQDSNDAVAAPGEGGDTVSPDAA
jgi:hypothetical protein